MTTRPHTHDRPAVDAGDDDELWVQVACSCPDPNGPDVVGRLGRGETDVVVLVETPPSHAERDGAPPLPHLSSGHRAAT